MAPLSLETEVREHILYVPLFVDKIPAGDRGKLQKTERLGLSMPKYTRETNDSDQELALSQSSNFDGNEEAMSILLKAQATVAKNRKQKEKQHMKEAESELSHTLQACAHDYAEFVGELEELFEAFQVELAASHDKEGKYWAEAVAEQAHFKESLAALITFCGKAGETREKAQIDALALACSSMNGAQPIASKTMLS
ncbi:hypothetical protein FRC09_000972 [Ceratobasidium sp. 395]|nr:hypothetical protein FRC09_000972 [Ceratobasidium sp. 395]